MILYHGSNTEIKEIQLSKGNRDKDFGQGFYLTDILSQAQKMAERRVLMEGKGEPVINSYEFDENLLKSNELNVKIFNEVSEEWAQFIFNNRKSSETGFSHNYDIVIGPVADDGVVLQLNLFEQEFITLKELADRLKYKKLNNQYFFGTQRAIEKLTKK